MLLWEYSNECCSTVVRFAPYKQLSRVHSPSITGRWMVITYVDLWLKYSFERLKRWYSTRIRMNARCHSSEKDSFSKVNAVDVKNYLNLRIYFHFIDCWRIREYHSETFNHLWFGRSTTSFKTQVKIIPTLAFPRSPCRE